LLVTTREKGRVHSRRDNIVTEPVSLYFVDEAGDLTLFGRRGKNLVGTEGVSKCFMVGMAHMIDPVKLREELQLLHRELLHDPYLKDVPSMQAGKRKTARCFHAKDDCPEVRMEVFKLLAGHDIKVQVGIRRKASLVREARAALRAGRDWNPNTVYDNVVKTLFKRSLHKAKTVIYFARRGKSDRARALREAIERARENFQRDTGISSDKPIRIVPSVPSEVAELQVIDYFLWALQRLYERGEDRYFEFLRPHYRLTMDFDDKRNKSYGECYSDQNPLTREKIQPVAG